MQEGFDLKIDGMEILCDTDLNIALRKKFHRAANDLNHSKEVLEKVEETIQEDVELLKKNFKPRPVVAARIYIIGLLLRETRSQDKIAKAVGTGTSSLYKLYKIMTNRRD